MRLARILILAISLTAMVVLGINCAKKSPTSSGADTYLGWWNWRQSSGGIAGWRLTPESEGYSQTLEFAADSIYRLYRDGLLINTGHYTVTWEETYWFSDSGYVIRYDDSRIEQVILQQADTLELVDRCADCFWHIYVRPRCQ